MLLNRVFHRDVLADFGGQILGVPFIANNGSEGFGGFAGFGLLSIGGLAIGGIALGGGAIGLIACGAERAKMLSATPPALSGSWQ